MSTRNVPLTPEPTLESTTTDPTPAGDRSPADRAPVTFAYRNTDRLQNLIDEFNAAFVDPRRD